MFRVYWLLLNIVFFFSRGGWGWVVSLCSGWSGCEAFCRSCELWSLRCFSIGRIFVSSCMWFMLVSEVHPVAILSPWFSLTCSAVSCLSEIIGAYIVPAYSSMSLVTVFYVFVKVSLFLPQWVEVRAFSILIVFPALSFEVLICRWMSVWGQRSVLVFWGCVLLAVVCCPVVVIVHLYILLGLGWRVLSLFYWHWVLGRLSLSKSVRLRSMVEVFVVLWYSFCRMSRWWCRLRMLLRGCIEGAWVGLTCRYEMRSGTALHFGEHQLWIVS